jgi:hypothetical protein
MNDKLTIQLRTTLIALLDDADGINAKGYEELQSLAISLNSIAIGCGTADIFNMVESAEDRYYLPENHGLTTNDETEPVDDTESNSCHIFVDCGGHPRCKICGCDEDDAYVGGEPCSG